MVLGAMCNLKIRREMQALRRQWQAGPLSAAMLMASTVPAANMRRPAKPVALPSLSPVREQVRNGSE